jgi:hypothetical protein
LLDALPFNTTVVALLAVWLEPASAIGSAELNDLLAAVEEKFCPSMKMGAMKVKPTTEAERASHIIAQRNSSISFIRDLAGTNSEGKDYHTDSVSGHLFLGLRYSVLLVSDVRNLTYLAGYLGVTIT